jgi:hypothetical protein
MLVSISYLAHWLIDGINSISDEAIEIIKEEKMIEKERLKKPDPIQTGIEGRYGN